MNINFDEASNAWRKNKLYIGNGSFINVTTILKNKLIQKKQKNPDIKINCPCLGLVYFHACL